MACSVFFVAVFILEDLFDPGFDWLSTAISEHSLGPYGWVQITNFIVAGLLFLVFAWGVAEENRGCERRTIGPLLFVIIGVCILLSGPFVTDPFPVVMFSSESTWYGNVHGLLGAIGYALMPVSCFVFYRRFRGDPGRHLFAVWSLVACVIIIVAIVLLKVAQLGVMSDLLGLFQRIVLWVFFGWSFALAFRLRSQVAVR